MTRIAVIGYGNRARKYLQYLKENPTAATLVAVVDSNLLRLEDAKEEFHLDEGCCFSDINDFFSSDIKIDSLIIATPDNLHFEPCIQALKKGCNVLLEKPIAQSIEECNEILDLSKRVNKNVTICYVLRFYPYYQKIKSIIENVDLGDMVSINHVINVGIDRTTHSYVRGIWNNSETSNPIILSKCCHDVDLILWLTNSRVKTMSSYGSLKWFKSANAPVGSAERCIDCSIERSCPFSAIDLYIRRGEWTSNFVVPYGMNINDVLHEEIKNGNYGKCIYHCNNDVYDHQIVSMEMQNGVLVNLSMDCFTLKDNRITNIKFIYGEIDADDEKIVVTDFRTRKVVEYNYSDINKQPYHAGADLKIMEAFLSNVGDKLSVHIPRLESSIESHKICFAAEECIRQKKMKFFM
ncbi:Gfo/Idh/MocA family oxidoreductase [uncultured Bacteroides sp.]|uniref:Gfo/Idh/MocA family protein n=1 Tax=uncultured Bacteroides sp. TaxID=162156 RepID=UPI0026180ACA|nr:Gfo/Idh/MocA family oxidoreductase [uncultured Bacteroides sp.]